MSYEDERKLAEKLRKDGQFEEALIAFQSLRSEYPSNVNEWDQWGEAFSLQKLGRSSEALEICRSVYKDHPEFKQIRSVFSWCVFDLEIKKSGENTKINEGSFLKAAKSIIGLTPETAFSPKVPTIFKVVDYLDENVQSEKYRGRSKLEWLEKLSPADLSSVCGEGVREGRPIEYASDLEKWYSSMSKALAEAQNYDACIKLSEQALESLDSFHLDSDVWFKYRIGLSKAQLGIREEAIKILQEVHKRKKDYFIPKLISKLLFETGELDSALRFGCEAALAPGQDDPGFRWELFMLLGQILQTKGDIESAKPHILLAVKVREENSWRVKPELASIANALGIDQNSDKPSRKLISELKPFWENMVFSDMQQMTGQIKKILNEGKSGFISGNDGKDYYFRRRSIKQKKRTPAETMQVRFHIQPATDGKRDEAINIDIME